jgi:hypothetical protein
VWQRSAGVQHTSTETTTNIFKGINKWRAFFVLACVSSSVSDLDADPDTAIDLIADPDPAIYHKANPNLAPDLGSQWR